MPFKCGDLERLYSECRQQLFTCALAITNSPARAEDAVHDAFCRLLRREQENVSAATSDIKAYVFRAVRNAAVDQYRRRSVAPGPLPDFVFDPAPSPTASAEDTEFRSQMIALLVQLPADERETIVEHLYGELTFQQIATIRDVPLGTVTSWYRRGLAKLRQKLEVPDGSV